MSYPMERLVLAFDEGIEAGLNLGGQIYISLDGQTILDSAFGEARPGERMTENHLMTLFSSAKPIGAVAISQLWERGLLTLDDRVADHIPEFGAGGKESITIRHLLTHTGGFRMLDTGWPKASWDEIIGKICRKRIEPRWIPGATAGYHRTASWFILGEIVRCLDGRSYENYVRQEIFEPLEMTDTWIGMPADRFASYGDRVAPIFDTSSGEPIPMKWDSEAWVSRCNPGANGRGPVRELGRFYQMLLTAGEGKPETLLRPQTVEALTSRHRVGLFDKTFQAVLDWGLGFVLNSRHHGADDPPYSYGPYASQRVFGHGGYRSSIGFVDPEYRLVAVLAVNGTPTETDHQRYVASVIESVYQDLDLA